MAEAVIAHASNIEHWADERSLAISAPKFTVTLFTPQFVRSNTHPQVTLINSLLPLGKTPCILGVTIDPHFNFYAYLESSHLGSPRINILKDFAGTDWGQQEEITCHLYVFYPIYFQVYSSHLVLQCLTIPS